MADIKKLDGPARINPPSKVNRTLITNNWTEQDLKEADVTRQWNKEFSNTPFYILAAFFPFIMWYVFIR